MAEGTRMFQLSETVKQLQGVSTTLAEEQTRQRMLMEKILQQLNNLATNFDNLVQTTSRRNEGEWTSQNTGIQANPLFEGHGGIQAGTSAKLRQKGSVEDYRTEFEILSNKISGLSEEFRISTFLSGLKDELRITVTMFKPSTLAAAFGLARLQEEEVNRKQYPYRTNHTPNNLYNSTFKTPPKVPTQNHVTRLPPLPPVLRLPAPQRPEPTRQRQNLKDQRLNC